MNINCRSEGGCSRRGMIDDSFGPVHIWVKLV